MGYYATQIVTNQGLEAIARTEAKQSVLTFTKIKTGTGTYTQQEISKLDNAVALKEEKQSFPVNSVTAKGTTLRIESVISNENVTEEYKIREIGVFARENEGEEFLAAISLCTDRPAVIPVFENVPIEMKISDYFVVSNAENFTIDYQNGAYVMLSDFENLTKVVESKIDKKNAAPVISFSNLENACTALGMDVKSYTTEEFAKTMPLNRFVQFTHRHDDGICITDAPHPYASMSFQKGRTVNYFFGTSVHTTSGDFNIYKYNTTSTNNEWHKVITEWDDIPIATTKVVGGFKTGYAANNASRNFPVSIANEKAYVNLPAAGSSTYGLIKMTNNLSSDATDSALTAAQGKALNDRFSFKMLSAKGTNTIATASVFSGYNEIMLKVTTWMGSSYFSYTFTIIPSSIGLGDGEEFFNGGYLNDGTHAFVRVRISRTIANIVYVNVSGADKTSDATLQLFYR